MGMRKQMVTKRLQLEPVRFDLWFHATASWFYDSVVWFHEYKNWFLVTLLATMYFFYEKCEKYLRKIVIFVMISWLVFDIIMWLISWLYDVLVMNYITDFSHEEGTDDNKKKTESISAVIGLFYIRMNLGA